MAASTAARADDEWASPGSPLWGVRVTFTIIPRPAGLIARSATSRDIRERALEVEPPDGGPSLQRDRLRRREVLTARVVHQHVDAAMALERVARRSAATSSCLADVALMARRRGPYLPGGLLDHLAAPSHEHDARTARDQLLRGRAPEAGATTGDEQPHDRPAGLRLKIGWAADTRRSL